MTDAELAELKRLAEAAPAGPWDIVVGTRISAAGGSIDVDFDETEDDEKTLAFIVSARTAVPALIAEVERLRAGIRDAAAQSDRYADLALGHSATDYFDLIASSLRALLTR